jgi:glycosyltransferase involved in cell wall biosynthesis
MNRVTVRGKYLYDGAQKFFARGVSYGPFSPNSRGERYPEPAQAATDFALMRDLGANLVRTYVPPPSWIFELAARYELRMMVGMPWPFHMAFLDSKEMTRDIRSTVADSVRTMKQFGEAILAYSLGNEIRSDIVRWHGPRRVSRFLHELYELGKEIDPAGLFTFSNYPSAEYLDLGFLDFVSFNVYLHRETDFRRYLTHLLASTADRPLVLSETGMDTIREGEDHQAELLQWQARAAFELGLCGFIVFAFTDEWHTGGAEITDWAFGLVTRERMPKQAFTRLAEVFKQDLPPPLQLPKATVIVCSYNAAATLERCLQSLKHLHYPDYEILVVDDGSTDATRSIAERAGVLVITLPHRGLAAARNAGIAAASGRIVAFIDSDAEADRDWLYHLAETITRRDVVDAGGQNFPPQADSAFAAAMAAAPGEPREVRAGDDMLDQVCGCSMAIDKTRLPARPPFDPCYTTAGDDVDFSWRMRERGLELAYVPGAIVIHRRRATLGGYLRQQIGYGRAEAALARKYPDRMALAGGVYSGDSGWFARWLGVGDRVYYGAFGRGLFQSLYRGASFPPLLQIPLNFWWFVISVLLIVFGFITSIGLTIPGLIGLAATLASAIAIAASAPVSQPRARAWLAILALLGPVCRSWARRSWRYPRENSSHPRRLQTSGNIGIEAPAEPVELTERLREALLERGATVAVTDGYQAYDLQLRVGGVRANINLLNSGDGHTAVGWKLELESLMRVYGSLAAIMLILAVVLVIMDMPFAISIAVIIWAATATVFSINSVRRIPPLIDYAVDDIVAQRQETTPGMAAGQ